MLAAHLITELTAIVGSDNIATAKQDMICYGYDATQMEFLPDAVVHPANAEEVSAVLKLANREGFPVFPRGAGSGFTGGALPKGGGVVLVTTRMNHILRIDTENLIAEVEPGVVTEQFQIAVEKRTTSSTGKRRSLINRDLFIGQSQLQRRRKASHARANDVNSPRIPHIKESRSARRAKLFATRVAARA